MPKPSAPAVYRLPLASDQALEFTWGPPVDDGGTSITGYRLTFIPRGGSPFYRYPSANLIYWKESGLVNGTWYETFLEASNDGGSTYGDIAPFLEFQPGNKPGYPALTATAVRFGTDSALVSWTPPPTLPDAEINWYSVYAISNNPADPIIKGAADGLVESSTVIEGLNPDSIYFFEVFAVNCPGYSPEKETNTIELIIVNGNRTLARDASGNMVPYGNSINTTSSDNYIYQLSTADLSGFIFNMNGINYGSTIYATTNGQIAFTTGITSTTYTLTSAIPGIAVNGRNTAMNRINYFRSTVANYDIVGVQFWFENTSSGTVGASDSHLSPGQILVRLIKRITDQKQYIEITTNKGSSSAITNLGQWAITTGASLVSASFITTASQMFTEAQQSILFSSDASGITWTVETSYAYLNADLNNSGIITSPTTISVASPLTAGNRTVPVDTSGNMISSGYSILIEPINDNRYQIPTGDLSGFTFNMNGINYGSTVYVTTNGQIAFTTTVTGTIYTLTSAMIGIACNGRDSRTNRITYFRTTNASYDILNIQLWFENTNAGSTGSIDYRFSSGQIMVRLIKNLSDQMQFVEITTNKGSSVSITNIGQWAIANGSFITNILDVTPSTGFPSSGQYSVVFTSDASGSVWQVVSPNAYLNYNLDNNATITDSSIYALDASPFSPGNRTVPVDASGNMATAGYSLLPSFSILVGSTEGDLLFQLNTADLSGFIFNMNGVNYGSTILVSTNGFIGFTPTTITRNTISIISTNVAIAYNGAGATTNRITYFRTTTTNYDIVTIQLWFENTATGTTGRTDYRLSSGQMIVRLIKNLSDQRQFIEITTNKGSSTAITTLGQLAIANGSTLFNALTALNISSASTLFPSSGQRSLLFVSDASGVTWKIASAGAYLNFNLDNSISILTTTTTSVASPLTAGNRTVPVDASGNMTTAGYTILSTGVDDGIYSIPIVELIGFSFNMNGTNYGSTIYVTTNAQISFTTAVTGTTYEITSALIGIAYNGRDPKTNRITYFRSTDTSYDILTIQLWFENVFTGTTGSTNYLLSPGQVTIRLIKSLSDQRQFVEITTNKGSSSAITNLGQWAITNGVSITNALDITTSSVFPSSGQRSIVFVSDASGSVWQVVSPNAYLNFNLDNSSILPTALIVSIASPLTAGNRTVPVDASGAMSIYGSALVFGTRADTDRLQIPIADLTGFIFNIRGANYGSSIYVTPNNILTFTTGVSSASASIVSANIAIAYNAIDNSSYRINYFRTTTASYDIITIQYFFESIWSGTSGATNSGRGSVGQMNIRLIKNLSDQRQFIELSSNNSSAITNSGQWVFADGVSLLSIPPIFPSSGQKSIVLTSDALGSLWQIINGNSYLPFELTTLYTELVNGVGVVTKDVNGNMTDIAGSTVLANRVTVDTLYTTNPTSFTFNLNSTNVGGTISTNNNLVMGLGASNSILAATTSLATTMRGFSFGGATIAVNRISWVNKTTVSSGGFSYDIVTYLYWFENNNSGITGQTNYLLSSGQQRVRFIKRSDGIQFVELCNVKGSSTALTIPGTWQMNINQSTLVNHANNLGLDATTIRSINMAITYVSDSTGTTWIPMYNTYVNV